MAKNKKKKIEVEGILIHIHQQDEQDYISLTDIAKKSSDEPRFVILNWLKNENTIDFLETWELLHNENFNRVQMDTVRKMRSQNRSAVSPTKWIELTEAIGMKSSAGRYGGTLAHPDIALNFCYWISPVFQLYFIKEYQHLKRQQAISTGNPWTIAREITRANYLIHTDAVRENLVPLLYYNTKKEGIAQASEADILNLAVFGMTASQYKLQKPEEKGNIRDAAKLLDLIVMSNCEVLNAEFIEMGISREERLEVLTMKAKKFREILNDSEALKRIKKKYKTLSKPKG